LTRKEGESMEGSDGLNGNLQEFDDRQARLLEQIVNVSKPKQPLPGISLALVVSGHSYSQPYRGRAPLPMLNKYCSNCLETRRFLDLTVYLVCEWCNKRLDRSEPTIHSEVKQASSF